MIDLSQMRALVIRPTLQKLAPAIPYSATAETLVLATGNWESEGYTKLAQIGGPAQGFWQIEPATEADCWTNFIDFRPTLRSIMFDILGGAGPNPNALIINLAYACAIVRVKYDRAPKPLPDPVNAQSLAAYYKMFYNTSQGAADVSLIIPAFAQALQAA